MAKLTSPDQIRVGHWGTFCCFRDMFQVHDEQHREDLVSDWADMEAAKEDWLSPPSIWPTKKEALTNLRVGETPEGMAEIDKMLAECE